MAWDYLKYRLSHPDCIRNVSFCESQRVGFKYFGGIIIFSTVIIYAIFVLFVQFINTVNIVDQGSKFSNNSKLSGKIAKYSSRVPLTFLQKVALLHSYMVHRCRYIFNRFVLMLLKYIMVFMYLEKRVWSCTLRMFTFHG